MLAMHLNDFNYNIPQNLIAQHPPKARGTSRLMVLGRTSGQIQHSMYANLADHLNPGDVLVINDTKVIKARLMATNATGQPRELLLLEDHHTITPHTRKVLYKGKLRQGEKLVVTGTTVVVDEILGGGLAMVSSTTPLLDLAQTAGSVPLPPYMHHAATAQDTRRYQTIFANQLGSVAAPTASLNFTTSLQNKLKARGVTIAHLTLHVGLGTFLPIRTDDITQHQMHSEYFEIPPSTINAIKTSKQNGKKVVALGTTVARTLEFIAPHISPKHSPTSATISGECNIFIYPGYEFKVVDALVTNFHAPKSTVLMLAAAFAGWPSLHHAYNQAIASNYALLSYGDSMLII